MTPTDYRNFDLLITRAGERYRAFVVDAPAGEDSVVFDLPFAADAMPRLGGSGLVRGVSRHLGVADDTGSATSLTEVGSRLFEAVFQDKVQTLLAASLSSVAQEGAGLRLRLRFEKDAAGLATLPWETLYDPIQGHFVGLGEQSPILRYLSLPRSRSALLVEPPLRVLAVLSSPADLPPLNMEREWQAIQDALAGLTADGKFVLERLATPSLAALQDRLLGEPVHILHFVGHGVFDESSQAGSLALEDARGRPHLVRGEQLATLLRNHPAMRLAYLNACKGALASGQSVFTGVAQTLVREGLPAAVAMQAEITDNGAIELARTFYTALAAGRPVDAALTQARVALSVAGSSEWAIPVLFSRSPDNRLFDIRQVLPTPDCPYPGMVPFSEAQKDLFFGRDKEIEDAVERLRQHPFLAVMGPSGSGKSSLIYAGVIPALRPSRRFGPGEWAIRMMRPGPKPLAALTEALDVATDVLPALPPRREEKEGGRTLLFVDQFEETFTLAEAGEAQAFLETLQGLIGRPNLHILLTVRADFYPELMASSLWQQIRANRLELTPLGDDELWAAIVEPAAQVGVEVDEALAVKLIADASGQKGVLPLVQETLVLLWDRVTRRQLSLAAYRGMADGARTGLQVAIDRRASLVYDNLPEAAQPIARRIFLRLIQFGEGRVDTRRQQNAAELRASGDDPVLFDQTLAKLTESRLLTASGDEGDPNRRVDIAHEALIAGWPRLQEWLAQRRTAEQIRRRLESKAAEWVQAGKRGGLLDEYELQEAENWLAEEDARELGTSRALADLVQASKEAIAQSQAKEAEAARSRQRSRLIAGGLALAIVFVALVGYFALTVQRERTKAETAAAEAQRQESEARRLAALSSNSLTDRDIDRALLLSVESSRAVEDVEGLRPSITARSAVLAALQYEPYLVRILDLPTPEIDNCKARDQESQLIYASLSKYDQGFADQYVAAARSCRPECLEAAQSDTEVSIAEVEPTTACLAACEDADGQLLDPYRALAQRHIDTPKGVYGCFAAPNASFIAVQMTKEPLGAGGVGTFDTQLRLWRVPQWNVLDMEVVERCEPDMLETGWQFDQKSLRLSVWKSNDQETPPYQLILPWSSDDADYNDNYTVKRVAVAPDKSAVAALVISGRFEEMLEIFLWDAKTRQFIGTLYAAVPGYAVDGELAYGLRVVGNSTAQVCHVAWDPLLADAPFYDQLVRVTLQLDEQRWLDHACEAAGRNLSLEEWERYMSDIPYRVTCPQWPAGK